MSGKFHEIADMSLTVIPSKSMIPNEYVSIVTFSIMVMVIVSVVSTTFSGFFI